MNAHDSHTEVTGQTRLAVNGSYTPAFPVPIRHLRRPRDTANLLGPYLIRLRQRHQTLTRTDWKQERFVEAVSNENGL